VDSCLFLDFPQLFRVKQILAWARMTSRRHRWVLVSALLSLSGCAAMITGSGTAQVQVIRAGTTELELMQRLGIPLSQRTISPARRAWDLREDDARVSLLVYPADGFDVKRGSYPIPPLDTVVSESALRIRGRLGEDNRAAQPGFDSFTTMGLAEIYLIPKALWERACADDAQLAVWFDSSGRALAFKWAVLRKQSPE
jgi:hypothetical protein